MQGGPPQRWRGEGQKREVAPATFVTQSVRRSCRGDPKGMYASNAMGRAVQRKGESGSGGGLG